MTSRADPDSLRLPSVQEIDFLDIPAVLEKVMDKASREIRASGVIIGSTPLVLAWNLTSAGQPVGILVLTTAMDSMG